MPDWFIEAQRLAEERLAYCSWLLEEDDEPFEGVVSEPVMPFCGCDTCVVREVLDAAFPMIVMIATARA